jgi:hypothetical protein
MQFIGTPHQQACNAVPKHLFITGALRQSLIEHFSLPENIEIPALRKLIWNDTPDSPIMIETVYRWRPELAEKRPALLLRRGPLQNQRIAIADAAQLANVGRNFATLWIGGHTIFAISRDSMQCELLASEVQRHFTEMAPLLRQEWGLHRLQVAEIGEIHEVDESTENFAVPVSIQYAYEERWTLVPESPLLSRIELQL